MGVQKILNFNNRNYEIRVSDNRNLVLRIFVVYIIRNCRVKTSDRTFEFTKNAIFVTFTFSCGSERV